MTERKYKRNPPPAFTLLCVAAGCCAGAFAAPPHPGWTLFYASDSTDTILIDLDGNIVHTWPSDYVPGLSVYLLDDGAILRTCNDPNVGGYGGAEHGGRLQRIAWDGTLEWDYVIGGEHFIQHHDVEIMPNGNILAIVSERYTHEQAVAVGRDPARTGDWVWSESVREIKPTGPTDGDVVWTWRVWDNLVQNFDADLPNFGEPADFPSRIDVNYNATVSPDWLHCNGVDYNAELDQIVVSLFVFDEIWIIPHAPGSSELLYRWGNPRAYGRGDIADRQLFSQHDPQWVRAGLPGEGHLTVFNNGNPRGFSSIDEIITPLLPNGMYDLDAAEPFGPAEAVWSCDSVDGELFFSFVKSGVQRLPNGNNLMCLATGEIIELEQNCASVWTLNTNAPAFRAERIDARDPRLEGLLFCFADLNDDGIVDATDFALFEKQFGLTGVETVADFDADQDVDLADFQTFQMQFGQSCVHG